ncbi:MAG: tRNA (adenosine(37)-N6)-dimethylallyltransferase MiaA [Coriobacteriaceae bacterium]|nr:tRNA (adenosine(37)-N6)-dimethylallyltransferase MiaA [Coriobacteriaceae bacterium]
MTAYPPLICIVGPTASGKSAVAEEIALRIGGEVVSVDAMQVYTGMDIGTAKTPVGDRRCPLHMVDVCPITENYSVERFQADARACIDRMRAAGTEPVLCGGTGLYLNAVIDEMDFAPGYRGDDRREAYEELARTDGPQAVYELLASRDPESAAAIHPNNVRRVIRALELADEGKSYAASLTTLHDRAVHYDARIFGLMLPREQLYRCIEARVDEMFKNGLVDEVRRLRTQGLSTETTAGQAIGYKEILQMLDGAITCEEARGAIKAGTRRYAKRQISWFKHDGRVRWIDMEEMDASEAASLIISEAHDGAL